MTVETTVVALGPFRPACEGADDAFTTAVHDFKRNGDATNAVLVDRFRRMTERMLPDYDRVAIVPGHQGDRPQHLRQLAQAVPSPTKETLGREPAIEPTKSIEGAPHRYANVAGTNTVTGDVGGEQILVVDDILASGASLSTAAAALRRSGASAVDGAVLGRKVSSSQEDRTNRSVNRRTS